ncbi:putative membrane protein [Dickeya phage phiDP23.1]|jgi:hypothetical protein|uniref:Uncharacterized protein n=5 Tax=Aglimvirinae TaxID=2169530 RepID=I0J2N3_9CAUD|nr:hypothetical protein G379_gp195 [Dickeya phage vB-DsoM-LIMEstone1]YP_009103011.1 hypothetical protein DA66_0172 [Dickeya phage RC-2014]AIM51563.1 putative membrane protein [Dickeya phage phiDP10.3]AIM51793.1 putative membrane protein [Dickeya phage phiDP23.1]AYN55587.1 hypothetical protein [Dickeya phage Kamild]AHZ60239.1 putative membrane protein [Dickeya phage RC-2014]CCD57570.1 hypothetical protein [Dickeya phage vB-DsoM-LIMEstone1]
MYKFRINRERNSFKFGVVAGVCLFLTLESVIGLLTISQMQVTRFLLAVVFAAIGLGCSYLGCVKK